MSVYKAINAVQSDMNREGITKGRTNQAQGYKFRGIDDVFNALSPLLAKHGLCVMPRILTREVQERQTAKGGTMFYVTVEAEFDFVATDDGSSHTVRTYGEAMDSADKATNKAMSAAYKYAALMTFAIPTEGDNDADAHTPDAGSANRQHSEWVEKIAGIADDVEAESVRAELKAAFAGTPPKMLVAAWQAKKKRVAERIAE